MARPKSFDPDEKLRDAMDLFWRRGFERTSIPMLEQHLSINRFSIYDTFGKKRALFLQSLDLYAGDLLRHLIEPLEAGLDGRADLERFLIRWRRRFVDEGVRGCLMCNTATEIGNSDAEAAGLVVAYFGRLEMAILACLERSRRLGETDADPSALAAHAKGICLSLQGALVTFATCPARTQASKVADAVAAMALGGWAGPGMSTLTVDSSTDP